MFEFVMELSEINTLFVIYTSIILSITYQYLNTFQYVYRDYSLFSHDSNTLIQSSPQMVIKNHSIHSNLIVIWIRRMVRRKESPDENAVTVSLNE